MIRKPSVLLLIKFEMLFCPAFHANVNVSLFPLFILIVAFKHKEWLSVADYLRIYRIVIAVAKGHIIDGIQKVSLPHSIRPDKAIDFG